jgi:hypothetical protein
LTRHKSLRPPPRAAREGADKGPFTFTIRPWDHELDDIPDVPEGSNPEAWAKELNKPRTFTAVEEIPGIVIMQMGRAAADDTEDGESMILMAELIDSVIEPDQIDRFHQQLKEIRQPGGHAIDAEELVWYIQQVLEEIMGRPTEGQPGSPGSLPTTPTGSTADGGNTQVTPV